MATPKTYYDKFWSPAFDTMEEFIFLIDDGFTVIRANQFFLNFAGKTQEEISGKKCHQIVHGTESHIIGCPHAKTLETGKFEHQEIYDPGLKKWLYVRTTPIFNDDKTLIGTIHLAADITVSKTLQENLVIAKKQTELIYSLAPSAIFTVDNGNNINGWNKKAENITGYTAEEVIGKKCLTFSEEPCKSHCGLQDNGIFKPITNKECTIKRKDGQIRIISKNADILRDADGQIIGGIESFEDITDRKTLENEKNNALKSLNERIKELQCLYGLSKIVETPEITLSHIFQALTNLLPSGFNHSQQACARVVFENQEFKSHNFVQTEIKLSANLFLYDHLAGVVEVYYLPSEINNEKPSFSKEETELLEAIAERLSHIIQREMVQQQYNVASEELRKQAQTLWETNLEIKTLYDELTEKNRRLQELDILKSDFIATVSHELRTPLVPIRESVALILDGILGETTEQQKNALNVGLRNIDRLTRLINDLLDLSKIEAGKMNLNPEETNLAALIENTISTFISQAKNKGLELKSNIPENLDQVYVDKDKITQVLSNLIGNSLKFTITGGVKIAVKDSGELIECSVSDTGPGINQQNMPSLFDKFQQFNTDSSGLKGSGLGLAISKGLIEAHGGEISAANNSNGHGSTFKFTLPKYDRKKALYDLINYQIAFAENANARMQLLLIRLDNYPELLNAIGQEKLIEIKTSLKKSIKQSIPQPNVVEQNAENELAIFMPYKPEKAGSYIKEIEYELKSIFFELEKSPRPEFSLAKLIYPKDGSSAQALIEKTSTSFINEKLERQSKTILLVDDEEMLVNSLKLILKESGYANVIGALTGEEALEKIKKILPGLIILDMKMPGMNGYEVLGRIKENPATKDIPVIIMSGFTVEMEKIQEYIKEHSIITISKPFNSESILKLTDYLL